MEMVPNGLGAWYFHNTPCQEAPRANKHFQWEKPLIRRAASDVHTLHSATLTPAFLFPVSLQLNRIHSCFIYFSACNANAENPGLEQMASGQRLPTLQVAQA